ncbi:hypothetical protein [Dyella silvae]|uniref:hypothetical protein n=1 Tax=Dyella silvae TaxID=2994424 RepID=UPI0022647BFD|nr:hypothetical protein [Dyella silvae]
MSPFEVPWGRAGQLQATMTVTRLLSQLVEQGFLDGAPGTLADQLVTNVWARKPDLFEGKIGPKPHKVSVAAIALASATHRAAQRCDDTLCSTYMLGLSLLLDEIGRTARSYRFHTVDHQLLDAAATMLSGNLDDLQRDPLLHWHGL